jgi:hypothetical protein
LLAVFGLTRHTETVRRLTDLVPCENCSFQPCQYRRAPYQRTSVSFDGDLSMVTLATEEKPAQASNYSINAKALQRWTGERLSIAENADGSIDAHFRYDGTTCTNMGRPLAYDYFVKLGPRAEGYPIREQSCQPAPGDTGHTFMCRYMNNAEHLMVAIDREKPLLGQPLADVLTWHRASDPAGCYCEPSSRKHKWGLVLETIHYALTNGK